MAKSKLTILDKLEKIDHTICLNVNNQTIKFGLDNLDHIDCKDVVEVCKFLDDLYKELYDAELIKKYPDEICFVIDSPTYEDYKHTFDTLGNKPKITLTKKQYTRIRKYFKDYIKAKEKD